MKSIGFVERFDKIIGPKGPVSFRIWVEDDGMSWMEWHCPEDGCWANKVKGTYPLCPHRKKTTRQGKLNWLCTNSERCKEAMNTWAIKQFAVFAKMFEERA